MRKRRWTLLLFAWFMVLRAASEDGDLQLTDGTIWYRAETGKRESVQIAEKCTDLWVSPDRDTIAFVAIDRVVDKSKAPDDEPLIAASRVYVAKRRNGFKPVTVPTPQLKIDGRQWQVFRRPMLSFDLMDVYFSVPYTLTTSRIFRSSLSTGRIESVGDGSDYCVVWDGRETNGVVLQTRNIPDDPSEGVTYKCYLHSRSSGAASEIVANCDDFDRSVTEWAAGRGVTCR